MKTQTCISLVFYLFCTIIIFSQSGERDTDFQIGTGFYQIVRSTCIQPDGKIIVGGDFTDFNGTTISKIARINSDGSLDNTFNVGTGIGINNPLSVRTTSLQTDGKIIVGGNFTNYNGTYQPNLIRLNSDGTIDNTFNTGLINSSIYSSFIQPDGKILIGGRFSTINGTSRKCIARLNSDGTLDTTFDPGVGIESTSGIATVNSIYLLADGKIILGGNFTSYNDNTCKNIALINSDGSLETTFDSGIGFNGEIRSLYVQADNKIIAGGAFDNYNNTSSNYIIRLLQDGTIDNTFNIGTGFYGPVNIINIQPDNKILVGGDYILYNGTSRKYLARLHSDGTLDPTFSASGVGFNASVSSINIQPDGKLIIGGSFSSYNGISSSCIIRLENCLSPIPDIATLQDINAVCEVTTLTPPTATSNCAGIITATHNVTLPISAQDTTIVTWTYNDGSGVTTTQTQKIIIKDEIAPTPDLSTLPDITIECISSLSHPSATDNCSDTVYVTHNALLPLTTIGTHVITWTYLDENGNTSTQNQNIIIIGDTTAPIVDIPILNDIISQCEVTTLIAPTATDNCAGIITGSHDLTLPIVDEGTTTITWSFEDGNGNTTTQTQNIIITPIDNSVTENGNNLTANLSGAIYQWIDCDNGNMPVNGATSQSFTPTVNGNYAVEITHNGCTNTSNCIAFNSVAIKNQFISDCKMYPNPTQGNITIEFDKLQIDLTIMINDLTGRIIDTLYFKSVNSVDLNLDVNPGLYNIQIITNEGYLFKKITLNH